MSTYLDEWLKKSTREVSANEFVRAIKKADKFGQGGREEKLYPFIKAIQWFSKKTFDEARDYVYGLADQDE